MDIQTIPELLDYRLSFDSDEVLFEYKVPPHAHLHMTPGKWHSLTTHRFGLEVKAIANFLLSLGLKKGDKLVILARSTYETILIDFAAQLVGIVVAPVAETASKHQLLRILEDLSAPVAYAFNSHYAKNLKDLKEDGYPLNIITAADLHSTVENTKKGDVLGIDFNKYKPAPDDISSIVYTSGVDGMQLGCPITHKDLVGNVINSFNFFNSARTFVPKRYLNFLSLAHIVPRIFIYACIYGNIEIGITPGIRETFKDMQHFNPNFALVVPKVYDSWYREIVDLAPSKKISKWLYNRAIASARKEMAREKFAKKIRSLFGGELCVTFSTGQKPDVELLKFFTNLGIGAYDCYGLTEVGGIVSMNLPYANKFKTAGRVIPGKTVEITEKNEIVVSSIRTGDLGEIDEDGYLTLKGRMREIIITSSGRNVTPEPMQQSLASDPIIENALVIGEGRPYISAIISIDRIHAEKLLSGCNLDFDSWEAKVLIDKFVQKAVNRTNHLVARDEQIKRYIILEDGFSHDDELISSSNKLRRNQVVQKYKDLIDSQLY
ncbi:MAG: AMP-binding protein [Candidatus Ancillula trichonymphae]|jgi:long-chain acyl-CoA synthetase|nr:AMP-binding protein [Candidatus Ancillula trichonymphae]